MYNFNDENVLVIVIYQKAILQQCFISYYDRQQQVSRNSSNFQQSLAMKMIKQP